MSIHTAEENNGCFLAGMADTTELEVTLGDAERSLLRLGFTIKYELECCHPISLVSFSPNRTCVRSQRIGQKSTVQTSSLGAIIKLMAVDHSAS